MKKIKITGPIISNEDKEVYEYLGINATSPLDIEKALEEANGEDINILLNSGGGSVFDGVQIYNMLNTYEGNITIDIVGIAASIASVIAMSSKVRMSPSSLLMIHNVSIGGVQGDYNDMDKASEMLKTANKAIANSYRIKTGIEEKELLSLMNKETYMSADEALKKGFIDEIINDKDKILSDKKINLNNSINANILPVEVVQNLKNKVLNSSFQEKDNSDFFMQQNNFLSEKRYEIYQQNLNNKRGALNENE